MKRNELKIATKSLEVIDMFYYYRYNLEVGLYNTAMSIARDIASHMSLKAYSIDLSQSKMEDGELTICFLTDNIDYALAHLIAVRIRNSREWILQDIKDLCSLAEMEHELDIADGETFEEVAYKAADILGVII